MCTDSMKTFSGMLQIMNGFRPGTIEGKCVIFCTKADEEWRLAQLTTNPIAPLHFLDGYVFDSVKAAQEAAEEFKAAGGSGTPEVTPSPPPPGARASASNMRPIPANARRSCESWPGV